MTNLNLSNFKKGFLLLFMMCTGSMVSAQLSGTYTIGGVSPDYTTLSAAINALNNSGVSGPVVFNIRDGNYSGTSWRGSINNVSGASATNTITFQSQSGNKTSCVLSAAGSSSANYIFQLNGASYIRIKNLTLSNTGSTYGTVIRIAGAASNNVVEYCTLTGHTGSSTNVNKTRIYGTSLANATNNTFSNNLIDRGSRGVHWYGNSTTSTSNNNKFVDNEFNQNYNYSFYCFYMGDVTVSGNTFTRSGGGTYYCMYFYYTANNFWIEDNEFNISSTTTTYVTRLYYTNYYSNNASAGLKLINNTYNITSGTNSVYPAYHYQGRYAYYADNIVNVNSSGSSGYIYNYFMYYDQNSKAENNTFNYNKSGGYIYGRHLYYGSNDTFSNNKITMTGNAYSYNYTPYYSQNYYVTNNDINIKTTNRTMYGAYVYYYNGVFANNRIHVEATSSGAAYGMYLYYQSGSKIYNNVITTKTAGSSYGVAAYYNYPGTKFFNNTIHSMSTGSTNYGAYVYHTSASHNMTMRNNIFSRSGSNGYMMYVYNSAYLNSDYNVFSVPSGNIFQRSSPSYTTTELQSWRTQTSNERNSLIYEVPFTNATAGDMTILASSPGAWAVNGRGEHDTTATIDIANNPRPVLPSVGVPDLGAYEVTPTSTPPNAVATPANPVANSTQVFTFGQDTVATIDWGTTVPATYTMRQYTGVQAAPMTAGVNRMYFYTAGTPATWVHPYTPNIYYKNPWIGNIPGEHEAVIARSSNAGAWEGYNYTNASTDTLRNILAPTNIFDSVGSYTGVQNGRIGIRCVENPKGIAITNITATTADIDWAAVFNPIGYQVIIKQNKKYPTAAEWSNSNFPTTNSLAANGLQEDSVYYVFVRSVCGVGDTSGFSMDSFKMLITCHTPVVKVTDINNNRAVVYWDTIRTATKYDYVFSTSPTPPAVGGTEVYKNNVLISFLDPGKEYYVHVRANCNSIYDKSGWGTVSFKTWPTGVENVSSTGQSLSVYPNPVNEQMVVTVGGTVSETGTLIIMDMTGKQLKTQTVNGNRAIVNVNNLPAGMYIVQYADENLTEQRKFMKQ